MSNPEAARPVRIVGDDRPLEVVRAERMARTVGDSGGGHREEPARTAYDCQVRVRRTG